MPKAGIVLHPDIFGNRELFDDLSRRLASHGFAVACVEPFARVDVAAREADGEGSMERLKWVGTLEDEEQLGDLEAAANLLVVEDDVARIGILGFCMGGMYALKAAALERFDAAVAFYGMIRVPDNHWKHEGLLEPLATAADVCPTLAVFGSADPLIPMVDIEALREVWAGRSDCEIVVIDGAEHGFVHAPLRPTHRPDDAARLWERALMWLS